MPEFDEYLNDQLTDEQEAPAEVVAEPTQPEPVAETEQEVEEEATDRPRDEMGRFAKANDEIPEPIAKRLADKDRFIGDLQRELGDLRQRVDQVAQPQSQDFGDVESIVDENPGLAPNIAYQALNAGDDITYERVMRAWQEVDPLAAARFDTRVQIAQAQWQLQAQIQPSLQAGEAIANQQYVQQAAQSLQSRFPDFGDVLSTVDPQETEVPPYIQQMLTDPARTAEALEATYHWAKSVSGHTLAAQSQAQQQEQAEQAHREKTQATVASASSPPASEGTGDAFVDSLFAEFRKPSPFSIR